MTWSIEDLADRVETAFQDHYVRTSTEPSDWDRWRLADPEENFDWDREGERTIDALQTAADIRCVVATDLQLLLASRNYDLDSAQMGEESEFEPDAHYKRKSPDAASWHREWWSFERALKTEARYFSRSGASHLAAVFNAIDLLQTTDGGQPVVEAGPGRELSQLFRARVFQSEDKLSDAVCYPDRHLGPPPPLLATAGRMNARGISVFYGATDSTTAISEVRPPVGSNVVVARFAITRPIRLLDLTVIETVHDGGSIFDPTLVRRLERVAFLRTLGARMSRTVMPDDEALDYLPTQAIADFLATENSPQLDGILFNSAQDKNGCNVVLFHKAARTAEIELPHHSSVEASTYRSTDEGPETEYSVNIEIPPIVVLSRNAKPARLRPRAGSTPRIGEDLRDLTLQVDPESLQVHHVESVSFVCDTYDVARHQYEKRDWKF